LNLRGRSTIEKFLVFFEGGGWRKYWGVSGASNKPEVAVWRKGAAYNEISKRAVWGGKKQIRSLMVAIEELEQRITTRPGVLDDPQLIGQFLVCKPFGN
jgi:hypothetical protein